MPYPINSLNDTIHYLQTGAVSFSLAWDMLCEQENFLNRLRYLIDTTPGNEYHECHGFLDELVDAAQKQCDSFIEKASAEKATLGGNQVYAVKEVNHGK